MTTAAIDKEALNFRREYKIKKATYPVLSEITEKLGYTVVPFDPLLSDANVAQLVRALGLGEEQLRSRGFTYANGEFRLVFINTELSDKEKTIVLSHELGHIVLGHTGHVSVIGHDVQEEFEANEFSTFLLKCDNGVFLFFNDRKPLIAVIAAVIVLVVILTAVSGSKTPSVPEQTGKNAPSESDTAEQGEIPSFPDGGFGGSELFLQIKTILEANLSNLSPSVLYDTENHMINVVCVPPAGTHIALLRDKSSIQESWDTLTDSLTGMSDETYKLCLTSGYKVGCMVMLVGDDDPDVCLYASLNGLEYCNIGK